MSQLILIVDRGVRSSLARSKLKELGISFNELNYEVNLDAQAIIKNADRPVNKYPLPQFYLGDKVVWENGFKDISGLTAEQINEKIEEINASN